ncbi:MAG: isoprenyl transferase [Clostridia bacterium]|nr:isoprenyl transferase [Clostridia bacterium]
MTVKELFGAIYKKLVFLFAQDAQIDMDNIPKHIGIIMDGNGRWAKRRGLKRSDGHRAGAKTLEDITDYCGKIGVKYLTVYAFSTENWKRPKEEVDAIMNLILEYLTNMEKFVGGRDCRIRVIGDRTALSQVLQEKILEVEEYTKDRTGPTLNIALNYGGRDEIVRAAKVAAEKLNNGEIKDINEEYFSSLMYTGNDPEVELIIRPSGEKRLSNFLLWQSAYSEFWFSNTCWPDFTEKHMRVAISDYQKRNRRYGGV